MLLLLTGAAQADVAMLVVNAGRGEFETGFEAGGQTREHAMLVRSLGKQHSELYIQEKLTLVSDQVILDGGMGVFLRDEIPPPTPPLPKLAI